jgi:hypothetical protein
MTITSRTAAEKMLKDPEIVRVYEYESKMSGKTAWACFTKEGIRYDDVYSSPYVGDYIILKDEGVLIPPPPRHSLDTGKN